MIKLAVVTATRAEYGLLRPVINELRKYENHALQVILIVSGTHLIADYGYTISEIESDGVRIDYKIKIPVNSATEYDISKNQANALVQFTELFSKQKFDAVILLGDRYETLSFAIAAGNTAIIKPSAYSPATSAIIKKIKFNPTPIAHGTCPGYI